MMRVLFTQTFLLRPSLSSPHKNNSALSRLPNSPTKICPPNPIRTHKSPLPFNHIPPPPQYDILSTSIKIASREHGDLIEARLLSANLPKPARLALLALVLWQVRRLAERASRDRDAPSVDWRHRRVAQHEGIALVVVILERVARLLLRNLDHLPRLSRHRLRC